MTLEIDDTVYPDEEVPSDLRTIEAKADYVHRVCSAFDFGVPPQEPTVQIFSQWKEVFDRFPLRHSPAFHVFRAYFGWEPVDRRPYFGEPGYVKLDRAEGRQDGCEGWV